MGNVSRFDWRVPLKVGLLGDQGVDAALGYSINQIRGKGPP